MSTKEEVLEACVIDGNLVKFPKEQLDRSLYMEVSNAIKKIGGKWKGGSTWGFQFDHDPTDLMNDLLAGKARDLKKEFQFFETPDNLAEYLVSLADVKENQLILEPSAGRGAIVRAIREQVNVRVHCFELMPQNYEYLKQMELDAEIFLIGQDFLQLEYGVHFDRIIANPPFTNNQDIEHVMKMYGHLGKGGRLVSIMSSHFTFAEDAKSKAFKTFLEGLSGTVEMLEGGEFKGSGTMVRGCIVILNK